MGWEDWVLRTWGEKGEERGEGHGSREAAEKKKKKA